MTKTDNLPIGEPVEIQLNNISSDELERVANPVLRSAIQNARRQLDACATAQHSQHTKHEKAP